MYPPIYSSSAPAYKPPTLLPMDKSMLANPQFTRDRLSPSVRASLMLQPLTFMNQQSVSAPSLAPNYSTPTEPSIVGNINKDVDQMSTTSSSGGSDSLMPSLTSSMSSPVTSLVDSPQFMERRRGSVIRRPSINTLRSRRKSSVNFMSGVGAKSSFMEKEGLLRREKVVEVPCRICGKRYKNQICLQKHAWEHHSSWSYAKRLMLNKHQSVQIMEAAQSLIMMVSGITGVPDATYESDFVSYQEDIDYAEWKSDISTGSEDALSLLSPDALSFD